MWFSVREVGDIATVCALLTEYAENRLKAVAQLIERSQAEEIKVYVWEKHNMKVSSLYISQVKRKCGLEVGQNYNLSKSENPKVPKCPAEKEAAIMDALKHFQMI